MVDRKDGSPVEACLLLSGLEQPNGIAYDATTGTLYVAEIRRIQRQGRSSAGACAQPCLA